MSERNRRAKEIKESIGQILLRDWDPIGVSDVPEAQDEYDAYVGGVYRLLASGASEDEIIEHLYRIESDWMGMPAADREGLRVVARKLIELNVSL
ncbi:MAG TPA: hypothetical protein VGW12_04910 [Pyrinomonadaceae bacterium]|nr:hypothetical protein [Pyrinomonadaceae bacterium]